MVNTPIWQSNYDRADAAWRKEQEEKKKKENDKQEEKKKKEKDKQDEIARQMASSKRRYDEQKLEDLNKSQKRRDDDANHWKAEKENWSNGRREEVARKKFLASRLKQVRDGRIREAELRRARIQVEKHETVLQRKVMTTNEMIEKQVAMNNRVHARKIKKQQQLNQSKLIEMQDVIKEQEQKLAKSQQQSKIVSKQAKIISKQVSRKIKALSVKKGFLKRMNEKGRKITDKLVENKNRITERLKYVMKNNKKSAKKQSKLTRRFKDLFNRKNITNKNVIKSIQMHKKTGRVALPAKFLIASQIEKPGKEGYTGKKWNLKHHGIYKGGRKTYKRR